MVRGRLRKWLYADLRRSFTWVVAAPGPYLCCRTLERVWEGADAPNEREF
jgi:hypothetical protein